MFPAFGLIRERYEKETYIVVTPGDCSAAVIGSGAEGILRRYEIEWWGQVFIGSMGGV